jgi:Na+/proline symporter
MPPTHLPAGLGIGLMLGLGAFMLLIAGLVRTMVRSTHDFVIAGRRIGLGFGVGSVIAVWTWSMAVMMSSAQAYTWGTSGLLWFIVPNGLAVVAMVPFALKLRSKMPKGYTIVEFIRARFASRTATTVMLGAMIFGGLCEVFINLFGVVLVTGVIFHLNATTVLLITVAVITVYSYFGGLWTSAITATFTTLMITVPPAIIVLYVLARVGGPGLVFSHIKAASGHRTELFLPAAASGFGISLALGLLASTMADQTFWQKAWAIRPANLNRTFLWAGLWFYPIPLTLGLLGLVGTAKGVTLADLGSYGAGGIGPYVISHLGLPVVLIAAYVLIICNACYSSIDGAFSALSSIVAVDIVKRVRPDIPDKRLITLTKASIVVAGVIGAIVVSSGIDYVNLVNLVFFIKAVLIFPLGLAIFWPRMTGRAFIASIVLGLGAGLPLRQTGHSLASIVALEGVSLAVAVAVSLLSRERFDYSSLNRDSGELEDARPAGRAAHVPATATALEEA